MSNSTAPLFPTTPIFIPSNWEQSTETGITIATGDKRYLKFPIGQGTETLPGLIVNNTNTTFNTSRLHINSLDFGGGYIQTNSILNDSTTPIPTTGWFNSGFGYDALRSITSGGTNSAFGEYETLLSLTSGNSNCAFGNGSLKTLSTTSFNSAYGYGSGYNVDGSNNTCIGANADCNAGVSNSVALGSQSISTQSNEIMLGTVNEKVSIPNQLQFTYTTNPTYSNKSLGYTEQYVWTTSTAVTVSPGFTIASFSNLPIGLYIFTCNFTITTTTVGTTRDDFQLTTQSNITNLSCSSTISYVGIVNQIKITGTPTFILQVTSPTNTLLYKLTQINGPGGNIEPSASTVTRIG
jgi:hypothetical protein